MKLRLTIEATEELLRNQNHLWKTTQIVELLKSKHGLDVKRAYVASVLHNVLGMRYKRVGRVAMQTNTEASLVKRQASAKVLLRELEKGRRILNIDETWIGEMDFRRMKWRRRREQNNVSTKEVSPRLSVIAGVDSHGRFYWTVTQANTDHEVFCAFVSHLVTVLNAEDANWRANTTFLLDNAPYHHHVMVLNQLKL